MRFLHAPCLLALTLTLTLALAPCAVWANKYTIVEYPVDGAPEAINDKGHIAGDSYGTHVYRGFADWGEGVQYLTRFTEVTDINERGDIVGWFYGGPHGTDSYIWPRNAEAPVFIRARSRIQVWGLNDQRVAVGKFLNETGCFIWTQEGGLVELGFMNRGKLCEAYAINNAGQVTGGASMNSDRRPHAFIWKDGVFQDLGRLPGHDATWGRAINSRGEVVGYAAKGNLKHAIHWDGTELKKLDPNRTQPSTEAMAINDKGEIVGSVNYVLAVRFAHGNVISLVNEVTNRGDWRLWWATGINNHGVIIGEGNHGPFMLIPEESAGE